MEVYSFISNSVDNMNIVSNMNIAGNMKFNHYEECDK